MKFTLSFNAFEFLTLLFHSRRVSGVIVDLTFSRAVPARKIAAIVCGVLAVMLTENVTLMCVDAAELQHVTVMEE